MTLKSGSSKLLSFTPARRGWVGLNAPLPRRKRCSTASSSPAATGSKPRFAVAPLRFIAGRHRSEERRVGKEGGGRGWASDQKVKKVRARVGAERLLVQMRSG